jgi:hypothetical protein
MQGFGSIFNQGIISDEFKAYKRWEKFEIFWNFFDFLNFWITFSFLIFLGNIFF